MAEKQTNKDRMREIVDSIENGIKELFESDKYRKYLATMSRFHRYSVNNTMLIYMQRPDATHVAGFNKWRDQFGRNVLKGEKGIRIIAPTPYKKKVEEIKTDPETNALILDADGKAIIEEKEIRIPMFKVVSVFDVSQTAGKPLPQLAADLSGNVQQYEVFMEALRRASPVPMEIKPVARDTDGFFSIKAQSITIRAGMSEVQTVCAAVHEIAHAKLHDYEHMTELADDGETILVPGEKSRNTEEVEAESISYAVCQYYGIETGENSFGYSLSIENQSLVLHEYAASMPEALNAEIMEFIDNGYSGTNFERPQVQKLIELVRANQIDCIIVKDFSRFGRNSIETGYFIERVFPLFHTRFISISDDFDSSKFKGDTGGMDVAFKYLISEYYSRDMSIKTKSAKYAKMQRGEYQSKICPYGYRKSADGRMEPDPEAAAVVQLIFQLAAEGINATAITRELFRRSIPTPGQYKAAHGNHTHDISRCHGIWSTSTILRILEDERYTGVYVIGKRAVLEVGGNRSRLKDRESWYIIPDHHPAIVEKAVFDTVQASQLRFSQPNKKKRDYPLKGKAFCGCCGHALSRTMQKTSYYHCRHSEADVESRCHKMRLNAAELEQAVFLTLKKQMEAAAPLAPDGSLRVDASVPERTEYEQQIEALQDGKRALYERYLMGEIDLNTYKAEKAACDELLLKTKNAYAAVLAQAKQKQDEQARQDSRKKASKAIFDADTLTTELAELLIDRVLVYPDKRIEIAYKIQDIFD